MSLFRKPKKIQRRVFSAVDEDEDAASREYRYGDRMDYEDDVMPQPPPPPIISYEKKEKNKDVKKPAKLDGSNKPKSLLSFADDEDDGEVFQVRKSSHSKKVMRMLDKERRKKKKEEREGSHHTDGRDFRSFEDSGRTVGNNNSSKILGSSSSCKYKSSASTTVPTPTASAIEQCKNSKKTDSIQTEIRTDDFVLVVKKSEPDIILNGRAAFCAGRNDISDDDDMHEDSENEGKAKHQFSKPDQLRQMLKSGSIPDAATIHAVRKRRQKAREQGDFIPVEETKEVPKRGSRIAVDDVEGDNTDDERVDMNAITGKKEREERREQFYSVEHDYSEEDSDRETNEWENQQIRKGVTGAQLVNAQQESVLSRFMIKSSTTSALDYKPEPPSTADLLKQAYAKTALDKTKHIMTSIKQKDKAKAAALKAPNEIREALSTRLIKLKELNSKHLADIERISNELQMVRLEEMDCKQKAPTAAAKYRFYQEIKGYVCDLVDCLNVKFGQITSLEKRTLGIFAKHQNFLIERRRQDVRDQAKEMAEASKPATSRRGPEMEDQIRRAAEREGRRTRRRCEREKNEMAASHLDGMSSDEETSDRYQEQHENSLEQINVEAMELFTDVNDDFCKLELILIKFYAWRKTDVDAYKTAFVNVCLPKIVGPLARHEMITWSPLVEDNKDIENMEWYTACMMYACDENETQEDLKNDPDINLVPAIIERIVLLKLTDLVKHCWDPLSTTQTLRLIGFINRLARDYPIRDSSKPLQKLFNAILDKMKLALENDVFIPIFPKQVQEAKTSFFQRQFCSGLKLFRNFLSWQGVVADAPLREVAISSLLNRYLLLAMRVCTANDAISKAYIIVNTLPTVWLQPGSETLKSLELFITYIRQLLESCDTMNPMFMQNCDKIHQILQRLHCL